MTDTAPFRMEGTVNERKSVAGNIHPFPRFLLLIFSSLFFGEFLSRAYLQRSRRRRHLSR